MTAPPGALVRIYYDGRKLEAGDYLQTPTGRLYLVVSIRVQARGKHRGRQHLACLVQTSAKEGSNVLPLRWYPRDRTARARALLLRLASRG